MNNEEAEKITEEFFKRRFPNEDLEFEKRCGYFGEWVYRFQLGCVESFMDAESKKVWKEMKENFILEEVQN